MRMVFHTIGKNLAASDNSVVVACLVEKDAITGFRIAISATETPACRYRMPLSGEFEHDPQTRLDCTPRHSRPTER